MAKTESTYPQVPRPTNKYQFSGKLVPTCRSPCAIWYQLAARPPEMRRFLALLDDLATCNLQLAFFVFLCFVVIAYETTLKYV